uniref:Secreted protein n=1 Tax=Pyxicephalus adspersus TaxID=30357 RepID=A0AAV3A350_PYXAD|nr:TPA: hypothetical protein GDO54_016313 [Pyxicephalus adspersus]
MHQSEMKVLCFQDVSLLLLCCVVLLFDFAERYARFGCIPIQFSHFCLSAILCKAYRCIAAVTIATRQILCVVNLCILLWDCVKKEACYSSLFLFHFL